MKGSKIKLQVKYLHYKRVLIKRHLPTEITQAWAKYLVSNHTIILEAKCKYIKYH